jgi:hypothetical protein
MPEKDQLDLLIDSAIATYAEPPGGLERGVLNALGEERLLPPLKSNRSTFPIRWIPWAIPLAACVILALFIHNHVGPPTATARNPAPSQPQLYQPVEPSGFARKPTHVVVARSSKPRAQNLASTQGDQRPKLDVFPAPQPLTPQEQALVAFVDQAPEIERKAVAQAHQQIEPPISIATIDIPPLGPPDKSQ